MDKIEIKSFMILALSVGFLILTYNLFTFQKKYKEDLVRIQSINDSIRKENNHLSGQVDSLQSTTKILAKSFLYIDSCNASRINKSDRAERRGRFLGGLLKGVLPGL